MRIISSSLLSCAILSFNLLAFAGELELIPHIGFFTGHYKTEPIVFRTSAGPVSYENIHFNIDSKGYIRGDTLRRNPFSNEGITMNITGRMYRTRKAANDRNKFDGSLGFKVSDGTEFGGTCKSDDLGLSTSCKVGVKFRAARTDIVFTKDRI